MNERIKGQLNSMKNYWQDRSKKQKGIVIGSLIGIIVLAAILTYAMTKQEYVPLYSDLPPAEAGQVKTELDAKGIVSKLADNGATILVPTGVADALKVELASKGIPKSGVIDYAYFGEKSGISMTDNEFNVVKLEAMQNELSKLMKGIDGIEEANVMITLPNKSVWVNDKNDAASASIVLQTVPGYEFGEKEIKTLYHLVSRSVPDLPNENIAITNQNFESFDLDSGSSVAGGATYDTQRKIKKDVERDIQRQVQQLLSTMIGKDKVVVVVSADLDFKKENRVEELVEPVDKENMQGIAVSAERIKETYSGQTDNSGGIAGTGETDIPNYPAGNQTGDGSESKKNEERINYEVNRIKKEIVESPYKVKDLGIQVAIEPPTAGDQASLPKETVSDIEKMLSSIVKTSITKEVGNEVTQEEIKEKVSVTVTDFKGKVESTEKMKTTIPWWLYAIGGALLLVIIVLTVLLLRRKKQQSETAATLEEELTEPIYVEDVNTIAETEELIRRKQLEKMAKEKPDEFTKVIKAWLAEE